MSDTTPKEWEVRSIRQEDNTMMASIIRRVMTEFQTVGPGYSINDPEVDEIYETYLPEHSAFLVLVADGEVLGGAGIAPLPAADPGVCELKKMYFLPAARGQGWGRKIITQLIDLARQKGYRECYLETVDRMESANHLYKKMGFQRLSCRQGDTGHDGCETFYSMNL